MDVLGILHIVFASAALIFGAVVFARPKGNRRHRLIGRSYTASMIGLNGTALCIYDLFGGFGPFHWAALGSLVTVILGIVPAVRKQPTKSWIERHAQFMSWSYVGLLAAAAAEVFTRVPGLRFWWAVFAASLAIILAGAFVIGHFSPLGRLLIDPGKKRA